MVIILLLKTFVLVSCHHSSMEAIIYISLLLTAFYVVLMVLYSIGWKEQKDYSISTGYKAGTKISIIVPARNEEVAIAKCIESILAQDYPNDLYELIVVDDHSTDRTAEIVQRYAPTYSNVSYLSLADNKDKYKGTAFKKQALAYGIAQCNGDLIITTDADCYMGEQWLNNMAAIYQEVQPAMIVAPVDFANKPNVVELFQSIDFMSMQGITAATLKLKLGNMCNGANLAFTKEAYLKVDGYSGIDHIASGDDYLLMVKINKAYPNRISYLKAREAIVKTPPQADWSGFLQQRVRWASKSGKYDDKKMTITLLLVYLFNFSFLLMFIASFFDASTWVFFISMLVLKITIELAYLFPVSQFYNKTWQLLLFPFLQPLHILYVIVAGFLGFWGNYQWKGRSVK